MHTLVEYCTKCLCCCFEFTPPLFFFPCLTILLCELEVAGPDVGLFFLTFLCCLYAASGRQGLDFQQRQCRSVIKEDDP